ncbi:hypothetical protein PILCRDRAFT_748720 [Piloderma croceum F 1598]|uniref:Uncharacterized protein n=1 Tax=Piloderma croceum (strain F 1598) TaxID=765440 RepID=A0A0C3EGM6_PILCF|nr:hypothetical protein PILCRDRAFT_748720 [Piloderma croceum F 1598]
MRTRHKGRIARSLQPCITIADGAADLHTRKWRPLCYAACDTNHIKILRALDCCHVLEMSTCSNGIRL